MAKYFVYEGLEFKTIDALPGTFGLSGNENLPAVDLISVGTALGTDIITATPDIKTTISNLWNTEGKAGITADPVPPADRNDAIQELNRTVLRQRAALNGNAMPGAGDDQSVPATINNLSWQYILPPGFVDVLYSLPTSSTSGTDRREYALVKSLQIDHRNIIKKTSASAAWDAWRRVAVLTDLITDRESALANYYVNPSLVTS